MLIGAAPGVSQDIDNPECATPIIHQSAASPLYAKINQCKLFNFPFFSSWNILKHLVVLIDDPAFMFSPAVQCGQQIKLRSGQFYRPAPPVQYCAVHAVQSTVCTAAFRVQLRSGKFPSTFCPPTWPLAIRGKYDVSNNSFPIKSNWYPFKIANLCVTSCWQQIENLFRGNFTNGKVCNLNKQFPGIYIFSSCLKILLG